MKTATSGRCAAVVAAGCLLLTAGCAGRVTAGVGTDIVGPAADQTSAPPAANQQPGATTADPLTTTAEAPAIGLWQLSDAAAVTVDSTAIAVDVTRLECSGGQTGTVLPPTVTYEADRILIGTFVAALPPGAYSCPGNPGVTVTVELAEPVGPRQLVDAACVEGPAVGISFCGEGAVRWSP